MPTLLFIWPAFRAKELPLIVAATIVSIAVAYALHRTVEPWGGTLIGRIAPRPAHPIFRIAPQPPGGST
jgi:hypothetical protein